MTLALRLLVAVAQPMLVFDELDSQEALGFGFRLQPRVITTTVRL